MAKVTVQYLPDYTYSQLLTAGHHSFVADEPPESGGEDLGPSPYELLLWALGACTSMTLLMYARRKGWDVADISVHLTHDRVHAQDSEDAEEGSGRVDRIRRDISVRGQLSEEQKERLLEIAGRCPVHKTIVSSPQVEDTIIVGE
ncbi:MAG: OsmC family protein [Dehalococcoidia bacterium]